MAMQKACLLDWDWILLDSCLYAHDPDYSCQAEFTSRSEYLVDWVGMGLVGCFAWRR